MLNAELKGVLMQPFFVIHLYLDSEFCENPHHNTWNFVK